MAASNPIAQAKKQKAVKLLQQGKAQDAAEILEQLLAKYPKDVEALSMLGSIYGQAGQLERAVHNFENIIEINPNDLTALNNLGIVNMIIGQKVKAAEYIERVIKQNPSDIGALYNLACIKQEQGDLDSTIDLLQTVLRHDPQAYDALINLGVTLHKKGMYDDAITTFKQALRTKPGSAEANRGLADLLVISGRKEEALNYYAEAISVYHSDTGLLREYARLAYGLGKHEDAAQAINQALQINPDDPATLLVCAMFHNENGDSARAITVLEHANAIDANNVSILIALSRNYNNQGNFEKAMAMISKVRSLAPNNIKGATTEISLLIKLGNTNEAGAMLQTLLEKPEKSAHVGLQFAKICKNMGRCDEAIRYLENILQNNTSTLPNHVRRDILFALGKLHDQAKQTDEAYVCFRDANHLKYIRFDCNKFHNRVSVLIAATDKKTVASYARADIDSDRPVFIVGMARSGSSLTEQILASHPEIHGAGELATIARLYREINPVTQDVTLQQENFLKSTGECNQYSQRYLDELWGYSATSRYVTDKMPGNYLYLGLIQQLFPHTRIVHTLRNPLDVCLSMYSMDFIENHPYAYDLYNLGCYYNEYRRLMRHWHAVLDLPIMDIRYEDLVIDQEGWTRKLLDFCELEWDDNCLQFHKSERVVNTASNQQVRQPIYKGSMQRWRPYAKHLQPLIDALEPEYRREAGVEDWDY